MTVQSQAYYDTLRQRNEVARAKTAALAAERLAKAAPEPLPIRPVNFDSRSANKLRPRTFADVIGQEDAKRLLKAAVASAKSLDERMEHVLLTGPGGTGKSTLAHVVGEELGVAVYQSSAPVAYDVLLQLREQMSNRDVLFVDEIHLMAIAERRGKESISQPEQFYSILEDEVLLTPQGPLPFPSITIVGATTDPGRLPASFLDRFTIRPQMRDYSDLELAQIAVHNVQALDMSYTPMGAAWLAAASGGVPRKVNSLVKQARLFSTCLDEHTVGEVLTASGIATDGLDAEQQGMLWFLYHRGETDTRSGTVYQSSLGSIATFLGLSRDTKAVQLYVEPLLIKRGYIQTTTQGRRLTKAGIQRAIRVER